MSLILSFLFILHVHFSYSMHAQPHPDPLFSIIIFPVSLIVAIDTACMHGKKQFIIVFSYILQELQYK